MAQRKHNIWIAPLIALALLAGLAVETFSRQTPDSAEPYHKRIKEIEKTLPFTIGDWTGTNEPIQREAIRLLKPNVIYNRVFVNSQTHQRVTVLIVQCKDARDIYGHYPPVCYPAHGMLKMSAEPFDRYCDPQTIHGMEYEFATDEFGSQRLLVDNFILLPSREIVRDMKEVKKRAWDYRRRFFGAAQVQVVYSDPKLTDSERNKIFDTMAEAHMPIIEAILNGQTNE